MQWVWTPLDAELDAHVTFRAILTLDRPGDVELRTLASGHFLLWLDGGLVGEGPVRYSPAHPEWESVRLKDIAAGRHVLAAHVHHDGVETRMLKAVRPFFACDVVINGEPIATAWRSRLIASYDRTVGRVNPELGWVEWADTRRDATDDEVAAAAYDDSTWEAAAIVDAGLGPARQCDLAPIVSTEVPAKPIGEGLLVERFGYERDDPPASFYLRDLEPAGLPPQGVWRRYDLGLVRLGRPRVTVVAPPGAVVEIAYAETLVDGRVPPWITLSAGPSCHLDRYVVRGGAQRLGPTVPRGARYIEVHVVLPPGHPPSAARIQECQFLERSYYGEPQGAFACGDPLLPTIWRVGVDTLRACAEDTLVDNPTRERGQWAGDVVGVGLAIAAAAYGDLRPFRRGLIQFAQCAGDDGMVAGLCPGQTLNVATYAAQWFSAGVQYAQITGDLALLGELYPAAERNVAAFERHMTDAGLADGVGWAFVDWGYVRNEGLSDMAMNLHYLLGLRDMTRWAGMIRRPSDAGRFDALGDVIEGVVRRWLASSTGWDEVGYHRSVLALRAGLVNSADEAACVQGIKRHMLDCFPNNVEAPRLSDPGANNPRLITPYFAHFAMPELIKRGETDFVLEQLRRCWGWMLVTGATTWLEVFDTRWSHCHQWSGCPTLLLSKYLLGLVPRFDLGVGHFELSLRPGSVPEASGRVPWPCAGDVGVIVDWQREASGKFQYHARSDQMLHLHVGSTVVSGQEISLDYEVAPFAVAPFPREAPASSWNGDKDLRGRVVRL